MCYWWNWCFSAKIDSLVLTMHKPLVTDWLTVAQSLKQPRHLLGHLSLFTWTTVSCNSLLRNTTGILLCDYNIAELNRAIWNCRTAAILHSFSSCRSDRDVFIRRNEIREVLKIRYGAASTAACQKSLEMETVCVSWSKFHLSEFEIRLYTFVSCYKRILKTYRRILMKL